MKLIRLFFRLNFSYKYFSRYSRLDGTMKAYRLAHDKRIAEKISKGETWAEEVRELLDKAREFLEDYKIDEAWRSYHTARRIAIHGLGEQERLDQAKELLHELSKLNQWRQEAIKDLLGDINKEPAKAPAAETLIRSLELKDEHYNNSYYKNKLSRGLYKMLFVFLVLVVGLLFRYYYCNFSETYQANLGPLKMLWGVTLFGLLGAISSSILFTRTQSNRSRITEINSNRFLVLSKIAIGVGFTIFIYILLKSEISDSIELFSFTIDQPLDYFVIAFASGFTERLAQRAISLVAGEEKKEDEMSKGQ